MAIRQPRAEAVKVVTRAHKTLIFRTDPAHPVSAARLTIDQISAALTHARRRNIADKAARIQAVLRGEQLDQPAVLTTAYAATTRAAVAVLRTLNEQVRALQEQVDAHCGQHLRR